ncbi:glycosyl hydrolase family 39 [Nitrosospira multiformis]|uniref:Glycosyl hydrolase family 39 n=1 Tax=Nitrosospira multiformis TaxID=1231 RepID=A0A2T5IB74_9PROT|nr:beta-galactosidase [Nitrosospira multiformis]PTQ81041.1 glycosyl hydrolase family 39 [Nitrosospira multiformis]
MMKVLSALLMISSITIPSALEAAAEINQPIPKEYFGLHIQNTGKAPYWNPSAAKTPWPSVKFGSWRLWDAYVGWPSLEPSKGKWDFELLDKYVALAENAGVELLLPLGLSPAWASARPTEPSNYRPGNAAEPSDLQDWRTYVHTVATRYKGRIKNYELWNEVNLPGFYSGSKDKLVELAREAYRTLKEVDPDIVFVSPSVTGGQPAYIWLDEYFAKGGASYLDVVGSHFYAPTHPPEAMLPLIKQAQAVMAKHGLDQKPLWNTEAGWQMESRQKKKVPLGLIEQKWKKLDDRGGAAYVARALVLNWVRGVSRFYWYSWDNVHMGLIELDTFKLKPAAAAYDRMARLLAGGILKDCSQSKSIWTCSITQADGKRLWMVWTEDDNAQDWQVPGEWNINRVEALDGGTLEIKNSFVRIGPDPIFLSIKK